MVSRFSLAGTITPEVDDRAAEREADDLAQTFQDRLSEMDMAGVSGPGGVGALGGARGDAGGGAGGAGVAGGSAIARGATAGGLAKVALGGVVGFGILKATQKLSQASPALSQTAGMLGDAMNLFFRPFGNFLSGVLRPFATAGLNMAVRFNELADEDGLAVALGTIGAEALSSLGGAFAGAVEDVFTGKADISDFLTIGVTTLAASKIFSVTTSSLTASSIFSITGSGVAASALVNTGSTFLLPAAALVTGTIAVDQLIRGTLDVGDILDVGPGTEQETDAPGTDVGPEDVPTISTLFGEFDRDTLEALGVDTENVNTLDDFNLQSRLTSEQRQRGRERIRSTLQERGVSQTQIDQNLSELVQEAASPDRTVEEVVSEFIRELRRQRQQQDSDADTQDVVDSISDLQNTLQQDATSLPGVTLPDGTTISDDYDPFQ